MGKLLIPGHMGKSPGAHLLHSAKPLCPLNASHVPPWCAQHSLWVVKALGQSCQERQPLPDSKGGLGVILGLRRASLLVEQLNRMSPGLRAGQFWIQVPRNICVCVFLMGEFGKSLNLSVFSSIKWRLFLTGLCCKVYNQTLLSKGSLFLWLHEMHIFTSPFQNSFFKG